MELDQHADAYLLSERELKVLLAGTEHTSVFGMLTEQSAEEREKKNDVYQTLFDMMRLNKIRSDGEAFSIEEPLRTFVRQIGTADTVLLIEPAEGESPLCCYVGESLTVCSHVAHQPEMLRIRSAASEVLIDEIMESLDADAGEAEGFTDEGLWQDSVRQLFSMTIYRGQRFELKLRVTCSPLSPVELETEQVDHTVSVSPYQRDSFLNLLRFYLKRQ